MLFPYIAYMVLFGYTLLYRISMVFPHFDFNLIKEQMYNVSIILSRF